MKRHFKNACDGIKSELISKSKSFVELNHLQSAAVWCKRGQNDRKYRSFVKAGAIEKGIKCYQMLWLKSTTFKSASDS